MTGADARFMALALSLGRRGMGQCAPNPAVGCVIVQGGRIVGRGWTSPGGRPHAEPQALAQAGELARGATVYVSLEPCAHHGQTPPCAEALIAAGIARVVAPFDDNDPRVAGRGFAMLRAAGIEVRTGVMAEQAGRDLAGFLMRNEIGRPLVTLKLASSFDGRIATAGFAIGAEGLPGVGALGLARLDEAPRYRLVETRALRRRKKKRKKKKNEKKKEQNTKNKDKEKSKRRKGDKKKKKEKMKENKKKK